MIVVRIEKLISSHDSRHFKLHVSIDVTSKTNNEISSPNGPKSSISILNVKFAVSFR